MFLGEKKIIVYVSLKLMGSVYKETVNEKNILQLLGLLFSVPRLNTEYFSGVSSVYPVGGRHTHQSIKMHL